MNVPLALVSVIIGGCLAIVGSLIVLNLRSIKGCVRTFTQRVDKQDTKIEKQESNIEKAKDDLRELCRNMASCKVDCDRNTVSKEDWVRSEGYTRKEIKELASTLNRIEGKITVVEKIPEICGGIVREVVTQLNKGGH